jgi:putative membrane protein
MNRILKQFNWRFLLVRIVVNALALAVTAAVTPKIYFVDKSVWSWLLIAVMLGILNALLKPALQFLTLQFIFVTYGLVIVLVNTVILLLLSFLFPARFAVDNLWWAAVGGLVLGLLSSFLENLLGLTMPIVPDEPAELRRQVEEQARHVDWLVAANRDVAQEEQALATEPTALEVIAAEPAGAGPADAEPTQVGPDAATLDPAEAAVPPADAADANAETAAAGPSTPEYSEGQPPPAKVEAEQFDSTAPPAEDDVSEIAEPGPQSQEEEEVDGS